MVPNSRRKLPTRCLKPMCLDPASLLPRLLPLAYCLPPPARGFQQPYSIEVHDPPCLLVSIHLRPNLLVQIQRHIIQPAGVLARGAGALPAAKRLEARPGAGGGALRPAGV